MHSLVIIFLFPLPILPEVLKRDLFPQKVGRPKKKDKQYLGSVPIYLYISQPYAASGFIDYSWNISGRSSGQYFAYPAEIVDIIEPYRIICPPVLPIKDALIGLQNI